MTKTKSTAIAFSILVITLVAGLQLVGFVAANPLPPPVIRVDSPQNNQVYPSGEVWLNFSRLPVPEMEVTSITYSLDGKAEVTTNGSTLLSGLPAGSHSLALYAKLSNREDYGFIITRIYFSINYSTSWVTFAVVVSAVLATGLLALFVTRHRLTSALKGKKTAPFWIGLCFLLLGALLFSLIAAGTAYDYLFPIYHNSLEVKIIYPSLFLSLSFVGIGLVLMWRGVKKEQASL